MKYNYFTAVLTIIKNGKEEKIKVYLKSFYKELDIDKVKHTLVIFDIVSDINSIENINIIKAKDYEDKSNYKGAIYI